MKRLSILILAGILSMSVFGQFSLGAKIGYNTSLGFDQDWNYGGSPINLSNDMANGFHLGVYARIGRAFYLQPELLYNYSVFNKKIGIGELTTKKITTNTIDIPVLAGYSIINGKSFKLRIMAGPKFSFNVGSTNIDSWDNVVTTAKGARVGLDTGIGIDIWRLNLDVRYNLMSDLYSVKDVVSEDKLNSSPLNTFTISLGFRLLGNNSKK